MKRLFDIICAALGLLVLLPFGLVIGLLIKLSDGGPVFYGQTRVGRHGKLFRIQKFRSMVLNADRLGVPLTKDADPRITRIGRFLRKSKIDELPQLWNVLVGEMSFVGPRPEVPRYVDLYTPEQREILNYKPGITDVATLLFRNEEALLRGAPDVEAFYLRYCLPKKIELNLEYERRASLVQDVWIILQTLCPYWVGVMFFYIVTLAASFWLSYQLRSDFQTSAAEHEQFKGCLPWIILPPIAILFWQGRFRALMSFFSIPEMRRIATALVLALPLQAALCYLAHPRQLPPLSILLINLILSFFSLCGVRVGFRLLRETSSKQPGKSLAKLGRVAIIGAGELGTRLALDLVRSKNPRHQVVAFFDDDPYTWHTHPYDIPVIGMPECLLNPEWRSKLDEIVVAMPEADSARLEEVRQMLKGMPWKTTFVASWPLAAN